MTSAKEGAVLESILPQQKKGDDDNTRLEFGESTSANESAVLETISTQQKSTTTVKHAKNSRKVPVMTSAKEGAFYRSRNKETTIIHAKNSEKVRAQRRVRF